jgi:hypothetical protein
MPESTEVQSPEDLREIVELAIAKGIAMAGKMRTQAPHPRTPRRNHVTDPRALYRREKSRRGTGRGFQVTQCSILDEGRTGT